MTTDIQQAYTSADAKRALIPLVLIFILGTLCLQAFNFVFQQIGADLGMPDQAGLITSIPSIILGIVCFIYGSISDFVSLKKMVAIGIGMLLAGSVLGFFLHSNIWVVILARCLQTAGGQVAGSVYLVIASRYLEDSEKVTYFGLFTAAYQLSTAIGIVASGFLSMVDWSILFLIPVLAVLVIPVLAKSMPNVEATQTKVDVLGFIIFGVAITLLTLFFSYGVPFLIAAIAVFAVFGVYISKASDPFITPDFFKNSAWLKAISLILIFYFINYSVTPVCNGVGTGVFGMPSGEVSLYLMCGNIVGFIVASSSGKVVDKLGRATAMLIAAGLMICGLVICGFSLHANMIVLTLGVCLFFAGMGMMFSPVTTLALNTLDASQSGRGIGMNDLVMNVSASIGIAVFGGIMGTEQLSGFNVFGASGQAATYSNLFLVYAAIIALGVVVFFCFRNAILSNKE